MIKNLFRVNFHIFIVFFIAFIFLSSPLARRSTPTRPGYENFMNRSTADLRGLKLEMLKDATFDFMLDNRAVVTGTIRVPLGRP